MKKILFLLFVLLTGCTVYVPNTKPYSAPRITYDAVREPSNNKDYPPAKDTYQFSTNNNTYSAPSTKVTKKVKRVIRIYKVIPENGGLQ